MQVVREITLKLDPDDHDDFTAVQQIELTASLLRAFLPDEHKLKAFRVRNMNQPILPRNVNEGLTTIAETIQRIEKDYSELSRKQPGHFAQQYIEALKTAQSSLKAWKDALLTTAMGEIADDRVVDTTIHGGDVIRDDRGHDYVVIKTGRGTQTGELVVRLGSAGRPFAGERELMLHELRANRFRYVERGPVGYLVKTKPTHHDCTCKPVNDYEEDTAGCPLHDPVRVS